MARSRTARTQREFVMRDIRASRRMRASQRQDTDSRPDRVLPNSRAHSIKAIMEGEPLRGYWFDRTQEYATRRRGEDFDRLRYSTVETLHLSPHALLASPLYLSGLWVLATRYFKPLINAFISRSTSASL